MDGVLSPTGECSGVPDMPTVSWMAVKISQFSVGLPSWLINLNLNVHCKNFLTFR